MFVKTTTLALTALTLTLSTPAFASRMEANQPDDSAEAAQAFAALAYGDSLVMPGATTAAALTALAANLEAPDYEIGVDFGKPTGAEDVRIEVARLAVTGAANVDLAERRPHAGVHR